MWIFWTILGVLLLGLVLFITGGVLGIFTVFDLENRSKK